MKRPSDLDDVAKNFYDRHAKRLKAEGLLTEATHDSYILLCRTYSLLNRLDPETAKNGMIAFIALSKQYQLYARGFGMSSDKPKKIDKIEEPDEFGI